MKIKLFIATLCIVIASCKPRAFNDAKTNESNRIEADLEPLRPGDHLDVNDVSILFPRPENRQQMLNTLYLGSQGSFGELLTREQFKTVAARMEALKKETDDELAFDKGSFSYERWRIAGMRFDPCFFKIDFKENDPDCKIQIRLVAMSVSADGEDQDQTLHLLYSPVEVAPEKKDEFRRAIVSDLVRLKNKYAAVGSPTQTLGHPLETHPAFKGPQGSAFANDVKAFILKYCGTRRLSAVAQMLTTNEANWTFFSMIVNPNNGKLTDIVIPTIKTTSSSQLVSGGSGRFFVDPVGKSPHALIQSFGEGFPVSDDTRKKINSDVTIIDHPFKSTIANVDCVSCHETQNFRAGLNKLGFYDTEPFRLPGQTLRQVNQTGDTWKVHNFSWQNVSSRVINESAAVANVLNKIFYKLDENKLVSNHKLKKYCYTLEKHNLSELKIGLEFESKKMPFFIKDDMAQSESFPAIVEQNPTFKSAFQSLIQDRRFKNLVVQEEDGKSLLMLKDLPTANKPVVEGFWLERKSAPHDVLKLYVKFDCDAYVGQSRSLLTGKTAPIRIAILE